MKRINKKTIINIIGCLAVCLGAGILFDKGTRSVLPPAIALGWTLVKFRNDSSIMSKAEKWAVGIISLCFSISVELVKVEEIRAKFDGMERLLNSVILFVALLLLFLTGVKFVWNCTRNLKVVDNGLVITNKKKAYWLITAIIFVLLFVGLLLDWPGDISKDSVAIINQALYESKMNTGFSFLIIGLMRICCRFALMIGADISFGVGIYNVIQIAAISLVEGYIVYSIAQKGINKYVIYAFILFFGMMPYNVHFSHTVWKDIPFTLCCVTMMFLLWQESMTVKPEFGNSAYWIRNLALVLTIIGTCVYRSNGYYAYILAFPFLVVLFWKNRKDICVVLIAAFILASVVQGPITDSVVNNHNRKYIELHKAESEKNLSKVKTDNSNMMGSYGASGIKIVTIQQIAAVAMNRSDLSNEDYELIAEVLDIDKLRDNYNPGISDNTLKARVSCETKRYLQIWVSLGIKYPSTYISAWKNMTYGYWYPDMQERWVYVDEMANNDYGIEKADFLPHIIYQMKAGIDRLYLRIPFYGLLWSIGFIVWVTAFAIALTAVKRGWKRALCYMPIVGVWISLLIATPVYGEFRYLYPFFLALPITLVIPYAEESNHSNDKSEICE